MPYKKYKFDTSLYTILPNSAPRLITKKRYDTLVKDSKQLQRYRKAMRKALKEGYLLNEHDMRQLLKRKV